MNTICYDYCGDLQFEVVPSGHAGEWAIDIRNRGWPTIPGSHRLLLHSLAELRRLRDALTDAIVAHEVGRAGAEAVERIADQAVAAPAPHDPRD